MLRTLFHLSDAQAIEVYALMGALLLVALAWKLAQVEAAVEELIDAQEFRANAAADQVDRVKRDQAAQARLILMKLDEMEKTIRATHALVADVFDPGPKPNPPPTPDPKPNPPPGADPSRTR